jgi:hypothetical protein
VSGSDARLAVNTLIELNLLSVEQGPELLLRPHALVLLVSPQIRAKATDSRLVSTGLERWLGAPEAASFPGRAMAAYPHVFEQGGTWVMVELMSFGAQVELWKKGVETVRVEPPANMMVLLCISHVLTTHRHSRDLDRARATLKCVVDWLEELGTVRTPWLPLFRHELALVYLKTERPEDNDRAIELFRKVLDELEKRPAESGRLLAQCKSNLAGALGRLRGQDKQGESVRLLRDALSSPHVTEQLWGEMCGKLGIELWDPHTSLNEQSEAEALLRRSVEVLTRLESPALGWMLYHLARLLFAKPHAYYRDSAILYACRARAAQEKWFGHMSQQAMPPIRLLAMALCDDEIDASVGLAEEALAIAKEASGADEATSQCELILAACTERMRQRRCARFIRDAVAVMLGQIDVECRVSIPGADGTVAVVEPWSFEYWPADEPRSCCVYHWGTAREAPVELSSLPECRFVGL